MQKKLPGLIFFLFAFLSIIAFNNANAARQIFTGDEIRPRLRLYDGAIVGNSDSLFLNHRKLSMDIEYQIDYANGFLYLKKIETLSSPHGLQDTLIVYYKPLPKWLKKQYGIKPGNTSSPETNIGQKISVPEIPNSYQAPLNVDISGAKKFSILSQTSGNSQFNQTLEMNITGELTPGLTITGSVSDKGYDASYGAVNSRISELDKLFIRLKSKRFQAEIGNLEITNQSDFSQGMIKQVSGLSASYNGPQFYTEALFARPRGSFKTTAINGLDKVQGPYRISSENQISAVVPGSERIWLDGHLLEKGADKDYTMDYPSATVTFTHKHPVNSRSRIEIDYEPLSTEYQKEMYQLNAGVQSEDSTLFFKMGFIREGDDKNRLRLGELSPEDLSLLDGIGDSITQNFRNGIVSDSLGSYLELFDSLGYRYFEYVGDSLGDYRISFTAVSFGKGDYIYEGNNIFRYTGPAKGDYLPVIRVPVPQKEDYYEAVVGYKPGKKSLVSLIVRQSDNDKNLYSLQDDHNNLGGQYKIRFEIGKPKRKANESSLDITANIINKNFKFRHRRNRPDLHRLYLIPNSLLPKKDEREYTAQSTIIIPGPYSPYMSTGWLKYDRQFESFFGEVAIYHNIENSILPDISYKRIIAEYDTLGQKASGDNEITVAKTTYRFSNDISITGGFEYDRRWNQYKLKLQGTTEKTYDLSLRLQSITISAQKFEEDTLVSDWTRFLNRDRLTFNFHKQTGTLKGDFSLIGQNIKRNEQVDKQFLARMDLSFNPVHSDLSINGTYSFSNENRFERGIRYIEVEPGQGQYIFVDSQYIPDPEGNYIKTEEIHSSQASVKRGEKSFNLAYRPEDIYLRMTSNISEELLDSGTRDLLWIFPFYSANDQLYLYRKLYHTGELKLFNHSGFYIVNLGFSYNYEGRRINDANNEKYETILKASLNESYNDWRFIQEGTYFKYQRDAYYNSPGNIDGFKAGFSLIRTLDIGQINLGSAYRFAENNSKARSKQFLVRLSGRLRFLPGGESTIKIEAYFQDLIETGIVSYRLTDNRNGRKGINWSFRSDYKINESIKISASISGRHSDDRKPRIIGRGELIASF